MLSSLKISPATQTAFLAKCQKFVGINCSLLILIILFRIYELFSISIKHDLPLNIPELFWLGLGYDLFFYFYASILLLLPYLLVSWKNENWGLKVYTFTLFLVTVSYLILVKYFTVTLVPMGVDVFGYETEEMMIAVKANNGSGGGSFVLLGALFFLALTFFLPLFFNRFQFALKWVAVFLGGCLLSILLMSFSSPVISHYKTNAEYYIVTNKVQYFFSDFFKHYEEEIQPLAVVEGENDYPLWHKYETPDVLGAHFNNADQPPNLVFVIVEGLSSAFSGENAYLGSFTPFIDSLAQESLYFPNFLSTTGRTFGVLPSLFAATPYADHGFLEMGEEMPTHQALLSILKDNDYQTNFFYGGPLHFDKRDIFFKRHGLDFMQGQHNFGGKYTKMGGNDKGFSWGYPDKALFSRSLEILSDNDAKARADVYLTLTTHDPYRFDEEEAYFKIMDQHMTKLGFDEAKKEKYQKYKQNYASTLYGDDALKDFFADYAKRADFDHTIFIITGDHRMDGIPLSTQIDRFRVPLLIYSPLLKKPQTIRAVSTHMDISPSIAAFLRDQYDLKIPAYTHWMGEAMDMHPDFRNTKELALMRNKNQLMDFVSGEYFLSGDQLYKVYKDLYIEAYQNDSIQQILKQRFEDFKALNKYVCYENKLMPNSKEVTYAVASKTKPSLLKNKEVQIVQTAINDTSVEAKRIAAVWTNEKLAAYTYEELFEIARQHAFNREFGVSRRITGFLLKENAQYHDVRTLQGRTYLWENKYKIARDHFCKVLEMAPDYSDAAVALVNTEIRSGRADKALEAAEASLSYNPKFEGLIIGKIKALELVGQSQKAYKLVNDFLVEKPDHRVAKAIQKRLVLAQK